MGSLQNYVHDEGKGVREETIFLFLDLILLCTNQIRQMKVSSKPRDGSKSSSLFKSFVKPVGDISCILKKLYYMNLIFDCSLLLNLEFWT